MLGLDLFCCEGGLGKGYMNAGFTMLGVDKDPQPRYPGWFVQADALEFAEKYGHLFDFIHASPPCQLWSRTRGLAGEGHLDLIGPTRALLKSLGKPYVIENVEGAPLENPLMLCGSMFGLKVYRHRLFEMSHPIYFPPAPCHHFAKVAKCGRPPKEGEFISIAGHFSDVAFARQAMGIEWMSGKGLAQAVPPAYTEFIGRHLMGMLAQKEAA